MGCTSYGGDRQKGVLQHVLWRKQGIDTGLPLSLLDRVFRLRCKLTPKHEKEPALQGAPRLCPRAEKNTGVPETAK